MCRRAAMQEKVVMPDEEPKIIIDEDWKAQVQREREEARKAAEGKVEGQAEAPTGPGKEAPERGPAANPFLALVDTLTAQCMFSLGVLVPRDAKEVMIDLEHAQFLVDSLMALREKTKGNLTPEEAGHLSQALAELQRVYVARAQQAQQAALRQSGVDPKNIKQQ